jgi:thioredoxin reductase
MTLVAAFIIYNEEKLKNKGVSACAVCEAESAARREAGRMAAMTVARSAARSAAALEVLASRRAPRKAVK